MPRLGGAEFRHSRARQIACCKDSQQSRRAAGTTRHDCSQLLLLAEAADDYAGSDNPIRFMDAFVDGPDLAVAGFGRFVAIQRQQRLRSLKLG